MKRAMLLVLRLVLSATIADYTPLLNIHSFGYEFQAALEVGNCHFDRLAFAGPPEEQFHRQLRT